MLAAIKQMRYARTMVADGKQLGRADLTADGREPASRDRVEALIKEHYSGLRLLILKSTRNEATAADILNDAIATALEHLREGRISQPDQIAGYIYQVAMNHLRNHRRKMDERTDNRIDSDSLDNLSDAAGSNSDGSDDALQKAAIARQVRKVIDELSTDRDRTIVKRFYLDEDDKDVICRELGLTGSHFDKVIFRARQRMKALLMQRGFKRQDFFLVICAI